MMMMVAMMDNYSKGAPSYCTLLKHIVCMHMHNHTTSMGKNVYCISVMFFCICVSEGGSWSRIAWSDQSRMSTTLHLRLSLTHNCSGWYNKGPHFSVLHQLEDLKFKRSPVNVSSNWITRSIGNFQPYMVPTAWNYCVWSVEKIWKILCRENNAWEFSYQHINHFQRSQNKINSYFSYFWTRFQKKCPNYK